MGLKPPKVEIRKLKPSTVPVPVPIAVTVPGLTGAIPVALWYWTVMVEVIPTFCL